jgi:hypothetical protein
MFHIITISSLGLTRNRRERAPTATNAYIVRPHTQIGSRYIVKSILTRTRLWLPPLQPEAELFFDSNKRFHSWRVEDFGACTHFRFHPEKLARVARARRPSRRLCLLMFTFCALCFSSLHPQHSTLSTHPFCLHKSLLLAIPVSRNPLLLAIPLYSLATWHTAVVQHSTAQHCEAFRRTLY